MHGYSHISKSGGPGELDKLPYDRMMSRLRLGFNLIHKSFRIAPNGFVPPLWKAPSTLRKATNESGFSYCVIGNTLFDLAREMKFTTAHKIVSRGDAIPPHTDAMLEIELGGPLQISLYPTDYVSGKMFDLLADMKDRLGYHFMGYNDFLASHRK